MNGVVMEYSIKDPRWLRKVLWADTALGGTTGALGLALSTWLASLLGLPENLLQAISVITLSYALGAFRLATQDPVSVPLLRVLVSANWAWTIVSLVLLAHYNGQATILGLVFLVLQIMVVAGLAHLEGAQIVSTRSQN